MILNIHKSQSEGPGIPPRVGSHQMYADLFCAAWSAQTLDAGVVCIIIPRKEREKRPML